MERGSILQLVEREQWYTYHREMRTDERDMVEQEIIKAVKKLQHNRHVNKRKGVLPWQVAMMLPRELTYGEKWVQRRMKAMAEMALLTQVGMRSGYLLN